MNFDRPQLLRKSAFQELLKGFEAGWTLLDLTELTTVNHVDYGPLTVVCFDNPGCVLVAKGAFEDRR